MLYFLIANHDYDLLFVSKSTRLFVNWPIIRLYVFQFFCKPNFVLFLLVHCPMFSLTVVKYILGMLGIEDAQSDRVSRKVPRSSDTVIELAIPYSWQGTSTECSTPIFMKLFRLVRQPKIRDSYFFSRGNASLRGRTTFQSFTPWILSRKLSWKLPKIQRSLSSKFFMVFREQRYGIRIRRGNKIDKKDKQWLSTVIEYIKNVRLVNRPR